MKTLVSAAAASGKVVTEVILSEDVAALHFQDGTAMVLRARAWAEGEAELSVVERGDQLRRWSAAVADELGLFTPEESAERRAFEERLAAERQAARDAAELREYQRLKFKFGDL